MPGSGRTEQSGAADRQAGSPSSWIPPRLLQQELRKLQIKLGIDIDPAFARNHDGAYTSLKHRARGHHECGTRRVCDRGDVEGLRCVLPPENRVKSRRNDQSRIAAVGDRDHVEVTTPLSLANRTDEV